MSLLTLLAYDYANQDTWIAKLDPRSKLGYSLFILFSSVSTTNLTMLMMILFLSLVPIVILSGFKSLIQTFWALKWFLSIYVLVRLVFFDFKFNSVIITEILKIIAILLSFYIFNKTTTPGEITDLLLKFQIPSNLAWSIGAAIRQANFMIEDIQFLQEIQANRRNLLSTNSLKVKLMNVFYLLSSIFSRSIILSENYASTLMSRNWQGAHREIILSSSTFKKNDFYFVLIFILSPLFIFSLVSRDIFM